MTGRERGRHHWEYDTTYPMWKYRELVNRLGTERIKWPNMGRTVWEPQQVYQHREFVYHGVDKRG